MEHDPCRQASTLKQVLSENKRPIALLLGAGCPLSIGVRNGDEIRPLIPDIRGLKLEICREYAARHHGVACDELSSELGSNGGNPFCAVCKVLEQIDGSRPSFENMLSYIRSVISVINDQIWQGLDKAHLEDIERCMCQCISTQVDKDLPTCLTSYGDLAAWIGATNRALPIEIFTTNYDLLMEQALEIARLPYFDGFSGSREGFLDIHSIERNDLPPRWTRVWKLHGSINWNRRQDGSVWRGPVTANGALIHPSHLKYEHSRRMPYLAMLDRLSAFIKEKSAVVITCGYSFQDEHLNDILIGRLEGNPTAVVFGLLYDELNGYIKAVEAASARPNLVLLAKDGGIISGKRGNWRPTDLGTVGDGENGPFDCDKDAKGTVQAVRFGLGDFARFGIFLRNMLGEAGGGMNG